MNQSIIIHKGMSILLKLTVGVLTDMAVTIIEKQVATITIMVALHINTLMENVNINSAAVNRFF